MYFYFTYVLSHSTYLKIESWKFKFIILCINTVNSIIKYYTNCARANCRSCVCTKIARKENNSFRERWNWLCLICNLHVKYNYNSIYRDYIDLLFWGKVSIHFSYYILKNAIESMHLQKYACAFAIHTDIQNILWYNYGFWSA